jgi:Holliday junction resolvase RusA-like endonuclease
MKIVIYGQVPALKNGKQIFYKHVGRKKFPFISSSEKVKAWNKDALKQLEEFHFKFVGRVQIDYMFYVKDDVQRDIDNMISTCQDILIKANRKIDPITQEPIKKTGIVEGDNWQLMRIGSADAQIDRKNPRVEMEITPI